MLSCAQPAVSSSCWDVDAKTGTKTETSTDDEPASCAGRTAAGSVWDYDEERGGVSEDGVRVIRVSRGRRRDHGDAQPVVGTRGSSGLCV